MTTEIIYNGVCPICRVGACDLERRAAAVKANLSFTDAAQDASAPTRAGVTLDDVRLKLHAILPDGRVVRGMPAVRAAWMAVPPMKPIAALLSVPPLSWLANAGYHVTAHILFAWNRACGRW